MKIERIKDFCMLHYMLNNNFFSISVIKVYSNIYNQFSFIPEDAGCSPLSSNTKELWCCSFLAGDSVHFRILPEGDESKLNSN